MDPTVINSTSSPILWKDIWWIKGIVLFTSSTVVFFAYLVIITVARLIGRTFSRRNVNNRETTSPVFLASSTKVPTTKRVQQSLPDDNSFVTERDDAEEFFDLSHHGIQFYGDNTAESNRQRRPRMHSTVTEATLFSMVRQRQRPGPAVVIPPAFPKVDHTKYYQDFLNVSNKPGMKNDQQLLSSSGDMRCGRQVNPTASRLSTVTEEENSDGIMSCDKASCKSEPSGKRDFSLNGNDEFTGKSQRAPKVPLQLQLKKGLVKNTSEYAEKLSNSTCKNQEMWSDKECPKLVESSFSAEDDAVEDIQLPNMSGHLECSMCKIKMRCICENCRSLSTIPEQRKKDVPVTFGHHEDEDDYQVQEEFIDDNFDDMESILTDEVTDYKS